MSEPDVLEWLEKLRLGELKEKFQENGYDDPDCIKDINASDLDAMQIQDETQRTLLLKNGPAFPEIVKPPVEVTPKKAVPKVSLTVKLEDGTPCPLQADIDVTAKEAVELVLVGSQCHKQDAANAWRLYEVFQVPPIERLLSPDEKLLTVMTFWPQVGDAPWFELRELSSSAVGVATANYKGALDKRGGSYKSWKTRHMRCVGQELHYFKSEPKNLKQFDNPVGKWFVGDAIIYSVRHLAKAPHPDICFCIKPVCDPMWPKDVKQIIDAFENGCKFLSASNETERANWIASLSMGMANLETELEKMTPISAPIVQPVKKYIDNPLGIKPAVEQPKPAALEEAFSQRPQSMAFLNNQESANVALAAVNKQADAAKPPPPLPGAKPKPLPDKPAGDKTSSKPLPAIPAPSQKGPPPVPKPIPAMSADVIDCDTYESTYEVCDNPHQPAASQPKSPPKLPKKPPSAAASNAAAAVASTGMVACFGEDATEEEILKYRRTTMVKQVPKAHHLPEDPMKWDSSDVLRWLKLNELEDFRSKFYSNGFEGSQLLALSAESFKKLGFSQDRCDALSNAINSLRVSYTQWKRGVTPHVNPKAANTRPCQDASMDDTYGMPGTESGPTDDADGPVYGVSEGGVDDPPENPEAIYGDHDMDSHQNPPEVAGEIYGDPNPPSRGGQESEEIYGDVDGGFNPTGYPEPSEELYGDANTPNDYPAPSEEIYGEAEPSDYNGGEDLYGDVPLPPPNETGEELYGDVSVPGAEPEGGEELYGDVAELPPPSEEIYGDAALAPSQEIYSAEEQQSEQYNVMPDLYNKVSDEPTYINHGVANEEETTA